MKLNLLAALALNSFYYLKETVMTDNDLKKMLEEFEESRKDEKTCPNCGRCPTCGKKYNDFYPIPYSPPQWPREPYYKEWTITC